MGTLKTLLDDHLGSLNDASSSTYRQRDSWKEYFPGLLMVTLEYKQDSRTATDNLLVESICQAVSGGRQSPDAGSLRCCSSYEHMMAGWWGTPCRCCRCPDAIIDGGRERATVAA